MPFIHTTSMANGDSSPQSPLDKLVISRAEEAVGRHHETLQREREGLTVPEDLTSCSIDLSRLGLIALPEELVDIIRDEAVWLALNYNLLTGLSALGPRMAEFSRLKYLYLRHNNLTEFPRELLDLPNIESLDFRDNQIESLPEDLNRLSRLKRLSIKENNVSRLPVCLGLMPSLSSVLVAGNPIVFPPPESWRVDTDKRRDESSAGVSIEVQETQALKRVLAEHAKGPKLRIDTDADSRYTRSWRPTSALKLTSAPSSEGVNLDSTPRPARRQASGRYPIRPSASSIDMSSLTAQASISRSASSASLASRPPALPLSGIQNARIPPGPRSAAAVSPATIRKAIVSGVGTHFVDRHRSQSEGQMVTSVREKRKGVIRAKHGSDQSEKDDSENNSRSRHARGVSYASTLQSSISAFDDNEESPQQSSAEENEIMDALASTKRRGFLWAEGASDRDYDHPFFQAIQYIGDRLYSTKALLLRLVEQYRIPHLRHSPFLRPFLAIFTPLDDLGREWTSHPSLCANFQSDAQIGELIDFTQQQFEHIEHGYEELIFVLDSYLPSIIKRFPRSYIDELMARCRSLREAWETFERVLEEGEMELSPQFLEKERQREAQERAIQDAGEATPLTSLRVRDNSNVPHGRFRTMTATTRPKPPPLRPPDSNGGLSRLNSISGHSNDGYNGNSETSTASNTLINTPRSAQQSFSGPGGVETNTDFPTAVLEYPPSINTQNNQGTPTYTSVHTPTVSQSYTQGLNTPDSGLKSRTRVGAPLHQKHPPMHVRFTNLADDQIDAYQTQLLSALSFSADRSIEFLPRTLDALSNAHRPSMSTSQHQTISRCFQLAQEALRAANELKYTMSHLTQMDLAANRLGSSRSLWDPAYVFVWDGMEFAAHMKEAITNGTLVDGFKSLVGKTNTPLCQLVRIAKASPWADFVIRKVFVAASGAGNGKVNGAASVPATPLSAALGPAVAATMPVATR